MSTSPSDHDVSDSSSSGTSFMKYSPYNSPSHQVPQLTTDLTELTCTDNKRKFLQHASKPFLQVTEQPQNHFRFRYVSEMIGTHGCLLGKSSSTGKSKTHPTVELVNYRGQALIRCHLVQHNNPDEHPHRLLEEEQDRDVSQIVPEQDSYKVAFGGIGIIHTAKKDVAALLLKKLLDTNRYPNANIRDLQTRCENTAKTINLNIVRLKFSAHSTVTGEEICEPVYSEPIHNLKSAATNDLKICRISRTSSSASGGEDVFVLVEKVNKKNIMIRLYELDENGERCWTGIGQFLQSDVHHQYAIVFRTPSYKDRETSVDVSVFLELVRPSDGRTSEPVSFKYTAEPAYKQIKKRKSNSSHCSIGSSSSGSLKSTGDIPISVVNQQVDMDHDIPAVATPYSMYGINQLHNAYPTSPNNCDLASALAGSESSHSSSVSSPMWNQSSVLPPSEPSIKDLNLNSADFDLIQNLQQNEPENRMLSEGMTQFFSVYLKSYNEELPEDKTLESLDFQQSSRIVSDSGRPTIKVEKPCNEFDVPRFQSSKPQTINKDIKLSEKVKTEYNAFYKAEDGLEVKKLIKDLCDMIRNIKGFKKQEVRNRLDRLFNIRLSNGDTFLHMSLCSNQSSLEYIIKIIYNVKATHLLDCHNDRQQTTLHLAILYDYPKVVSLLIEKGASPMIKDSEGMNAVHYAVKYKSCLEPLLEAMKRNNISCLNDYNSEKQSALHMAVIEDSEHSARLLLQYGASYSTRDPHGRTPLHLAAYDDRRAVAAALLDYIPLSEIDVMDHAGNTALQIVCGGIVREHTIEIARLLLEKKANPLKMEDCNESAWRLVRDKPQLKALLWPYVGGELMDEDDIKSEPDDDFESTDEGDYPEVGLQELSVYSREISILLDASGSWRQLAKRLRLDALHEWYSSQPSPTLTLLNHLKESRDDITSRSLALILEDMGEINAAAIIRKYIQ